MLPEQWVYYLSGAAASVAAVIVVRHMMRTERVWPTDTVVIHHTDRAPWVPSLSPFASKLETYMRMAEIPYINHFVSYMGPKGFPWIIYNGEVVADSQFSIEYLKEKLDVDLNQHLTDEQRAVAKAFQRLTEDNLVWVLRMWISLHGSDQIRYKIIKPQIDEIFGRFSFFFLRRKLWQQCYAHGMARHNKDEILQIYEENIKSLSDYLGNKKYLMGDTACEVDCTVFGTLAQFCWHLPGSPLEHIVSEKYPNLRDYCLRLKNTYWPDWDDCITHGFTKNATK